MSKALDPLVRAERTIERLALENTRLRTTNKKLARRGGGYDDFIEEFRSLLDREDKFQFKTAGAPLIEPVDPSHSEIACAIFSDLHLSETVRPEDANGINEYNSIIAANRLWQHVQKLKSILARHMTVYTIEKIWVPMLGDMLNGSIHPEMIITNDLTDPAAVVLGARLLEMAMTELSTLGLPIEIDAIHGNHPRLTAKMPTKRQAHTNLDWLVYEMLSDKLSRNDQIGMTVHTSQIGQKRLYGWQYLFEHGIQVKSGAEESFEDSLRALFDDPTYRAATGYRGAAFDQVVVGNMHKPKFLERTIVNGTYTGQNELGMSWRLKPIKAMQLIWGVSKKQVRTWEYMINLTDIRSKRADNPFSEYAAWFMKRHGR